MIADMGGAGVERRPSTFEELPEAVRDEVRRLARGGELHTDPDIVDIAMAWALRKRSRVGRGKSATMFGTGLALALAAPGWLPGPSWPTVYRDNNTAKRLVKLAESTGWTPIERPEPALELRQQVLASDLIRRETGRTLRATKRARPIARPR